MRNLWIVGCLILSSWARAETIKFSQAGGLVKSVAHTELGSVTPAQTIEVLEPHEEMKVSYKAYPAAAIFDAVFGPEWKKREEVLFTCSDGYQPSIPVAAFLSGQAYFAFEREGQAEFALTNKLQANEKVNLGPLYLVWDNLKDPQLQAEGASQWPYQVVGIDLVTFQSRFSHMAPDGKAPASVKRGFLEFRKSCTNCHRINGSGGEKSIELNYPMSVSEYFKPGFLGKWIDQPQKVRWNSAMPPFNPAHPQRAQAIDDIVAYLQHMASRKREPVASGAK